MSTPRIFKVEGIKPGLHNLRKLILFSKFVYQHRSIGRHPFFAAFEAQLFGSCRFDRKIVDIQFQVFCLAMPHIIDKRSDFGTLQTNDTIDITDRISPVIDQGFRFLQQELIPL